jgi:hypothetical protein
MFSIGRWKPRHLLGAWIAYWVGLAAVTLGPAIAAMVRVLGGEDGKGSISLGFENAIAHLTVMQGAATMWTGTAHLLTIALWIAVPPLVLWTIWMAARGRIVGSRVQRTVILQAVSAAAITFGAAARRAERSLVRQLRATTAIAPASAILLTPRSRLARWQLARLGRSGAVVHTGDGRYWLDDAAFDRHRTRRRRRALVVLAIVLPIALAVWWW